MKSRIRRYLARQASRGTRFKSGYHPGPGRHARLIMSLRGHVGIAFEQRILSSACNRGVLHRRLLAKAIRLGANLGAPVNSRGMLSLSSFCRHAKFPFEAHTLIAAGANPHEVDPSGRNCAHYAFEARNLAMCEWLLLRFPETWKTRDVDGNLPLDLALGERGTYFYEEGEPFRLWAFERLDADTKKIFLDGAVLKACSTLPKSAFTQPVEVFAWLSSIGAKFPDEDQALRAIENSRGSRSKQVFDALAPYFAIHQKEMLETFTSKISAGRPKRASSL